MSKYELTWVNESEGEYSSKCSCYYNDEFVMRIGAQLRIKPSVVKVKKYKDAESLNRYREWYILDSAIMIPDMPIGGWHSEEEAKADIQKCFDIFCNTVSRYGIGVPKENLRKRITTRFLMYVRGTREDFALAVSKLQFDDEFRAEVDNLLIAYDQMNDLLVGE